MALCIACAVADGFYEGKSNTSADLYEQGAEVSNSLILSAMVTFG
jgi:hypothetical protein